MAKAPPAKLSRETVAGNLQLGRAIFGYSQDELGARCNLNRSHISAIERQELNVGVDTIGRIAMAFNVSASVLLMPKTQAQAALYEAFAAEGRS